MIKTRGSNGTSNASKDIKGTNDNNQKISLGMLQQSPTLGQVQYIKVSTSLQIDFLEQE